MGFNVNEVNDLTHFSDAGRARMVDVSEKNATRRVAVASGVVRMQPATLQRIRSGKIAKGDVLAVADVGGDGGQAHGRLDSDVSSIGAYCGRGGV